MERDFGVFEDGPDGDRELLFAGAAVPEASAVRLALHACGLIEHAAVRADRAFGPQDFLKMGAGRVVVVEHRVAGIGFHSSNLGIGGHFVKCI